MNQAKYTELKQRVNSAVKMASSVRAQLVDMKHIDPETKNQLDSLARAITGLASVTFTLLDETLPEVRS